jgi:hypothetical protein
MFGFVSLFGFVLFPCFAFSSFYGFGYWSVAWRFWPAAWCCCSELRCSLGFGAFVNGVVCGVLGRIGDGEVVDG